MSQHPSNESLEQAWRADYEPYADGQECPSDAEIFEAVTQGVDIEHRRSIVEHTAICGACAQSWRIAAEIERARPGIIQADDQFQARWRRPVPWAVAAAAVSIMAIGVVWMLPQIDPGTPPPGDVSVLRGNDVEGFGINAPDEVTISGEPPVLSWQAVDNAREYHVRIVDDELNPVYAATVETNRLKLPTEALYDSDDGQTIYWYVLAMLTDGAQRRSETKTIVVHHGADD